MISMRMFVFLFIGGMHLSVSAGAADAQDALLVCPVLNLSVLARAADAHDALSLGQGMYLAVSAGAADAHDSGAPLLTTGSLPDISGVDRSCICILTSVYIYICTHIDQSIYLSACLPAYLSIYLSIHLSIDLAM